MLKILGTLKGVSLSSKEDTDHRVIHQIGLKLELSEGLDKVQDILELIKQIVSVEIISKQPSLLPPKK